MLTGHTEVEFHTAREQSDSDPSTWSLLGQVLPSCLAVDSAESHMVVEVSFVGPLVLTVWTGTLVSVVCETLATVLEAGSMCGPGARPSCQR